jgi:ribonuclease HI
MLASVNPLIAAAISELLLLVLTGATWITSVRQFLFQHNMSLTITDSLLKVNLQGPKDQYIMQSDMLKKYSPQEQRDINLVRLHLQAITLSDISSHDGKTIRGEALNGLRSNTDLHRRNWPKQPAPTKHQSKLWKRYIVINFIRHHKTWKVPLGPVLENSLANHKKRGQPECTETLFRDARNCNTFRQYIGSLPRWYRRLLSNYEQRATELQIWKAFRRKSQMIEIASDGGLSDAIGTFGWKIVTVNRHNEVTLFQGSGPIDGPHEIGSSTRSELGGYTAPLLLVTALAKFWGIRHKCAFRWYTDSKAAISKVKIYSIKGASRKYPEHSDYMMVIQELQEELRRPIAPCWVKGHQDEDRCYDELPREAKLNIDVDQLATQQYVDSKFKNKPMRFIDHIPCQRITLAINGQRYPSNWDTNIRWSINGTFLKQYLTNKYHSGRNNNGK